MDFDMTTLNEFARKDLEKWVDQQPEFASRGLRELVIEIMIKLLKTTPELFITINWQFVANAANMCLKMVIEKREQGKN